MSGPGPDPGAAHPHAASGGPQALWESADADYVSFWSDQARGIRWFDKFGRALDWDGRPFARWFVGGTTNACHNAVDRHLGREADGSPAADATKPAIIWEAEDGSRRTVTYGELHSDVQRFANVLLSLGVERGDRVAIYMPMVPEIAVAMLGCARVGAVHTVIFSGFSAASIRERVGDSGSKVIVTADGGYRRGKVVDLKRVVDEALSGDGGQGADAPPVRHVVVLRRTMHEIPMTDGRDVYWDDVMSAAHDKCIAQPLDSSHPLFILYTSGTTGKPKGVLHGTGGYLVHVYSTFGWAFGDGGEGGGGGTVNDNDVYFCTADVGWVTGHSYVVYGPLMHGITSVMYEGAPDHPDPARMWRIIRDHKVTIFYTTPTLLRMLMRFDDGGLQGAEAPGEGGGTALPGLGALRLLGTVGEPINPEVWRWYHNRVGGGRCPIIDTWWQTETGGMLISPLPATGYFEQKPGSATRPVPGVSIDVVDDDGGPVPAGTRGHLVVRRPWPGMMLTLWGDDDRYAKAYWSRFPGLYHSGDYARIDEDGCVWILGRADDVLKVAGHRIGTAELEGCVVSHADVAESAVCGIPDEIKGESIVVFAVPRSGIRAEAFGQLEEDISQKIRDEIGPIATPGAVHAVLRLPKTRSGKIMRRLLRSIAMGEQAGDTSTLEDADAVQDVRSALLAKGSRGADGKKDA